MALIRLDPGEATPYIPYFDRKNDKDPLTVYIKYLPAAMHDEYYQKLGMALRELSNEQQKIETSKAHDRKMFLDRIVKIENFLGSDGDQISDVEKFYYSIDIGLRTELLDAMTSQARLTAGQRKNS